jgi:IS5 family transposase
MYIIHRLTCRSPALYVTKTRVILDLNAKGINGIMDRAVRNHKLPIQSIRRNLRISRIRSMVEHPYAFFKRMFHYSHVMVTTVQRIGVKTYFTTICYNLMRARFLDRIE